MPTHIDYLVALGFTLVKFYLIGDWLLPVWYVMKNVYYNDLSFDIDLWIEITLFMNFIIS